MSHAARHRKARHSAHHRRATTHHRLHRLHQPHRVGVTLTRLTPPMVDRVFWRAGYGPNPQDRHAWTGRKVTDLASWFLSGVPSLVGPPPTNQGSPLDPTGSNTDLVLEWVDRMVRTTNPFVERFAFFLHRHFANGLDGGPSQQMIRNQVGMFRGFASFGQNPNANFRDLLRAVTIDPSMLVYLTGNENVAGHPNENYAREVMELFCLGIADDAGRPNYTLQDIQHLAHAFTGWQVDNTNPDAPQAFFDPSLWSNGPKSPFGATANYQAFALNDPLYDPRKDACEVVLRRPPRPGDRGDRSRAGYVTHARFFLRELWREFIASDPDEPTLTDLVATYLAPVGGIPGLRLRPVLFKILTHPLLFASLDEPDMVKPPVVYVAGVMRSLGVGIHDDTAYQYLDAMGELPYNPPNVSGWEGGAAWLNTNTVLWRFALAADLLQAAKATPTDQPGESATDAVNRALAAVGSPWIDDASLAVIRSYATQAPAAQPDARIERQVLLRTLALCGPDGQVM
jgi:uncharacterized protein (DUF1800 family)